MNYTETKPLNIKNIETIVYIVIWLGIFSIPFFQNRQLHLINWENVSREWIKMSAFLLIFTINAYVLVPRLLFRKKYAAFITYALLLVVVVISISTFIQHALLNAAPLAMPPMNLGPGMPPMELGAQMPAPMGYKIPVQPASRSLLIVFADNFIISFLVVAAGTTLRMTTQWINEEDMRIHIEKEQLKTELALLRHQVSPHFFMNTLNNIHALVDIDTDTAKDAIIRLSTLMRYLLYETAHGYTSLKKEMEFIESYISLMKLRFSSKVIISVDVPVYIPDIQVPPMLFISFIENAFKHGVSYQAESYVVFKLEITGNRLLCTIRNSKHKRKEKPDKNYSGIGMNNIRKSLELLYSDNYSLGITETEKEFEARLDIPMLDTNGKFKKGQNV